MGIRTVKPTSAARRYLTYVTNDDITKTEPEKSLLMPKRRTNGRNGAGRITVRHRGGGAKRMLRQVDFRRDKLGIPARVAAIEHYRAALPSWCVPVTEHPESDAVYHLAVVQVPDRAAATRALDEAAVGWGVHYPVPCHLQPAFAAYADGSLPVAEAAAGRILSLPLSPTITTGQVDRVCEVLRRVGA